MAPLTIARLLLVLAGLYDGILGVGFLVAAPAVFTLAAIPEPPHWGYVHFSAALLIIFALMFFSAATFPAGSRNLVAYGILLKLAYVLVAGFHHLNGGIPWIFTLFMAFDALWLVAFLWIWLTLGRSAQRPAVTPAA